MYVTKTQNKMRAKYHFFYVTVTVIRKSLPFGFRAFSFKGFNHKWEMQSKTEKNKNISMCKKWSHMNRALLGTYSIAQEDRQYRCSA